MTKIISLFEKRKEIEEQEKEREVELADGPSFEEIMKINEEKKKKAAKERLATNKGVLRSYRIKH